MLLTAAVLVYHSSRGLTEEEKKGWKGDLVTQLEGIQRSPPVQEALRCYFPTGEDIDVVDVIDITNSSVAEPSDTPNISMESSMASFPGCVSIDASTSFRSDVRQEWIKAVFGAEFRLESDPNATTTTVTTATTTTKLTGTTRQGVGLAKIPSYTAYNVTIPANLQGDKLGITLSRLSLGLYVRSLRPGSEAWCAGIKPNSVLVEINGMRLLAEPSRQALERIWQYEGHFEDPDDIVAKSSSGPTGSGNTPADVALSIRDPVKMTFIHHGQLYSVVLLSNPPYGIDWSPCGNFALVQRAYAFGADAGVKTGSIVAAVNEKSIYELDHTGCATELRKAFESKSKIELKLCFTPSAARSGHFERQLDGQVLHKTSHRPKVVAQHDGVKVRVHPLLRKNTEKQITTDSVAKLAYRVAAGELYSLSMKPCRKPQRERIYRSCPPTVDFLESWDPVAAIMYCIRYHEVNYDENRLALPNGSLVELLHRSSKPAEIVQMFLLQFLCLVATGEKQYLTSTLLNIAETNFELARHMELVAQSFDCEPLQKSLVALREEQEKREGEDMKDKHDFRDEPDSKEQAPKSPLVPTAIEKATIMPPPSTSGLSFHGGDNESFHSENTAAPTVSTITPPPDAKTTRRPRVFAFFRKKKKTSKRKQINCPPVMLTAASATNVSALPNVTRPLHSSRPGPQAPLLAIPRAVARNRTIRELPLSPSKLFSSTALFIKELEKVYQDIEGSLLRSFPQKIAEWALQPWSASKGTALAQVTQVIRERLAQSNKQLPLLNPIDTSNEILTSLDTKECYILPSAHFPLLLTFNCQQRPSDKRQQRLFGVEKLYRTKVEIVALQGAPRDASSKLSSEPGRAFIVDGAVFGAAVESGRSLETDRDSNRHVWDRENVLTFDSRSSWGAPQTLSLRVSEATLDDDGQDKIATADRNGQLEYTKEVGFCWVDLGPMWQRLEKSSPSDDSWTVSCQAEVFPMDTIQNYDDNGDLSDTLAPTPERLSLELRVTTKAIELSDSTSGFRSSKRSLLYKHDDDLRQEMFAIQFVETCDNILKACGLDLKMLIFRCVPVGKRRGFIEWIPGSVPLSEICQPFAGSILGRKKEASSAAGTTDDPLSAVAKAGLTKYESLHRGDHEQNGKLGSLTGNPIQDFLRSIAFKPDQQYMIRKEVMDTYVKSCAGYCVVTYLLGVGDRHLDNLLLHRSGHFFHCDFSFILGSDPKKYLPMRITEDMVQGMGGRKSDNFAMFLSLACAAFLTLRRPENVRQLMSLIRSIEFSALPDISENQSLEAAVLGVRERLRLDLSQEKAIEYMEKLVEDSLSSKMWIAVDAIHSLGKRF